MSWRLRYLARSPDLIEEGWSAVQEYQERRLGFRNLPLIRAHPSTRR